jgi:DNA-directed RNA polymerase specialized sigma24 family protein
MNVAPTHLVARLADPALTESLSRYVRTRVPESEVDDIVQATLADALASEGPPAEEAQITPWVHGICRHKVVDWFRRAHREVPRDLEGASTDGTVPVAESAPQSARDLLRWAKARLPEGEENAKTLEWMLREGEGEKLEAIAAEANLPAPRVRQRVSRLRRYYRVRWAAEAAALAALIAVTIAILVFWRRSHDDRVAPLPAPSTAPRTPPAPVPGPSSPLLPPLPYAPPQDPDRSMQERAAELRHDALDRCAAKAWLECLRGLDEAKQLDPAADAEPAVQAARKQATDALAPPPRTVPSASDVKVTPSWGSSSSLLFPDEKAPSYPSLNPDSPGTGLTQAVSTSAPPAASGFAPASKRAKPRPAQGSSGSGP